jgi:hypothetical protein
MQGGRSVKAGGLIACSATLRTKKSSPGVAAVSRLDLALPPLLPQHVQPFPWGAAGVEATGVAVDQLVNPRQDDTADSLGFHLQGVAGLEARFAQGAAGIVTRRSPEIVVWFLACSAMGKDYSMPTDFATCPKSFHLGSFCPNETKIDRKLRPFLGEAPVRCDLSHSASNSRI